MHIPVSYTHLVILDVANNIFSVFSSVFTWITDNVSAGDIFAGLAGGGIFVLVKKIGGVFDKIQGVFDNFLGIFGGSKTSSIKQNFCDILDSIHGALESFTTGIKTTTLLSIAAAIGILSVSLKSISELKGTDITKSLFAIASMMTILSQGFRSLTKSITRFNSKGIVKSGIALILVAKAINILVDVMIKLSDLSLSELGKRCV